MWVIVGEVASCVHQNLFFFPWTQNGITFPSLLCSEGWSQDSSVWWYVGRSGDVCSRPSSIAVHRLLLQLIGFSVSTATLKMIVENRNISLWVSDDQMEKAFPPGLNLSGNLVSLLY